ncbi:hemin receptor [Nakamurella silvestris]|nr:hemin receptor [Nakamurella silvestris]
MLAMSACGGEARETLPIAIPSTVAGSETSGSSVAQVLADRKSADPKSADPKSYVGSSTAVLRDATIHPIADNPAQTLPATVKDAQGTSVTITDTSRILALDLYGSLSRTVFELGLGDKVVGRDTSSRFPEIAGLPLVTQNGHELNGEAILELAPTVILTDTTLGPWDVILQMRESGIPVVVVDSHRNMTNIASLTEAVADALGVPELGAELGSRSESEAKKKIAEIARIAPSRVQDKLRMVFLYVRGQAGIYYMFGEDSGADALIEAVGGYDVSGEIGWKGMKPVNDEGLIAAQPDLILMMSGGLESVGGVDGLLERLPAIAQTPAGQHRRIVDMDDTEVLSFGPRTADVLDALATAIYSPPRS